MTAPALTTARLAATRITSHPVPRASVAMCGTEIDGQRVSIVWMSVPKAPWMARPVSLAEEETA